MLFYIKDSLGTIIDHTEARNLSLARATFCLNKDLAPSRIAELGWTIEPAVKNGEIWETKSGNTVLIVDRPSGDPEVGFIWFDPIDRNLCYATLMDQLSHRVNMSITEWAMTMTPWVPPVSPL